MTGVQSRRNVRQADDPLWLVVEHGRKQVCCYELSAHSHRAIAVGSGTDADLRIDGTPVLAFFIEREGSNVWLMPAYADSTVRVDTRPLLARRQLIRSSIFECATTRLELIVRDTPPTLRGSEISLAPSEDADLDEIFKEFERGRDGDSTQELCPSSVPCRLNDPVAAEFERHDLLPPEAFPTQTLEMLRTDFEHLFESGDVLQDESLRTTQRLFASAAEGSTLTSVPSGASGGSIEPRPIVAITRKQQVSAIPAACPVHAQLDVARRTIEFRRGLTRGEPQAALALDDPFGLPMRTDRYWPVQPATERVATPEMALDAKSSSSPETLAARKDSRDRPAILLKPELPPITLLAKLGILTRKRPLSVLAGTAFGAVVMAFFLVGVSEVISGRSDARLNATAPSSAVSTETHESAAIQASSQNPVGGEVAQSAVVIPVQVDAAATPAAPRPTPRQSKHLRR